MRATRRAFLWRGGGCVVALSLPLGATSAEPAVEIAMGGLPDGSRVWFDPVGVRLRPGQSVRWTNRDAGNSHTATAYHPANDGRPRRMPVSAEPWDSGYLLPGEQFSVAFTETGVFDYCCIPHERAGMVGRIVVEGHGDDASMAAPAAAEGVPRAALDAFPGVDEILRQGLVRPGMPAGGQAT